MNILAVVAHPDDELLGCGATLRRLADKGNSVFTVVLCSTADARHARPSLGRLYEIAGESERIVGITDSLKYEFKNIQFNTVPHLDMVRAIETAIEKFRPSWVFTHHVGDLNVTIASATRRSWRPCGCRSGAAATWTRGSSKGFSSSKYRHPPTGLRR